MNELPSISVITVTYGRVAWLEEAIACFLNQDYRGKCEMIVFNTCPQQVLQFPGANASVRVFNCTSRPNSIGEARNQAIASAENDIIITLDDDDKILSNHLSWFAEQFSGQSTNGGPKWMPFWIWQTKQFWMIGEQVKSITAGSCPTFAFRKHCWEQVGGYPSLSCGEDRGFISKVTEQFPGAKVEPNFPTFLYCWGNGLMHASGEGDGGAATVQDRAQMDFQRRVKALHEKTGFIPLYPKLRLDWKAIVEAFVGLKSQPLGPKDPVCIVELGRFGDIINILPICQHIANEYGKPTLMVAREFMSILDGVSYVNPYPVNFDNADVNKALAVANKEFKHVICAQIWGRNWFQDKQCQSYNMESWRMTGFLHKFRDFSWKPYFDQRDFDRELALWKQVERPGKRHLLVNLTAGVSSPFPRGAHLLSVLKNMVPEDVEIVDLSKLKAPKIYDVLGLLDRADALLTIDSMLGHLAAASDIPTVLLTNPLPWLGTIPRFLCDRIPYDQIGPAFDAVDFAIGHALAAKSENDAFSTWKFTPTPPTRQIFHVCERHEESDGHYKRRKNHAMRSWDALYQKGVIAAHLWEEHYPRNAFDIGESRPLPFVKDVIKKGLDLATDDDIVFFTNDDNWLHSELPELLQYHVSIYEVCCSQRCEFMDGPIPPSLRTPADFANAGRSHMGRDLFAATKRWWMKHWDQIPDMIIGASDWDLCFASIVRNYFGIKTTRKNLEECIFPAELPRGYVSHQAHAPKWAQPDIVNTCPSNMHNRRLFKEWASTYAPWLHFHPNGTI